MSKSKKSGKRQNVKNWGDITINDFANSSVIKSRTKKSSTNVTQVIKKELGDGPEKAWDEQVEDYDFVQEENEDGSVSYVMKRIEPRRRRKTQSEEQQSQTGGYEYPLDIWFLISEYVRPEDVGRFAGICKTSFAVVCTAKFWFSMYKRYYRSVPSLPERLQPECMLRLYGVRTSVVRALHFMYSPFVERVATFTPFEQHPDVLLRRQCVLMWYQKQNKQWLYYFKLKENVNYMLTHNAQVNSKKQPDLIEMLEDVSANPDENCRVLQVTCTNFIPVPAVLGYTLTSVSLKLSHGFRHHKLQLVFGSGVHSTSKTIIGGDQNPVVHLDPVINLRVLDWWHPLYPHSDNMELLTAHDEKRSFHVNALGQSEKYEGQPLL